MIQRLWCACFLLPGQYVSMQPEAQAFQPHLLTFACVGGILPGLVKAAERCPQLLEGPAASTSFSDQLLQQHAMRNTSSGGRSTAHTESFGRPRSAQSLAASIISNTAHAHAAARAPSFAGGMAGGPRSGLTLHQSSNGGSFFR